MVKPNVYRKIQNSDYQFYENFLPKIKEIVPVEVEIGWVIGSAILSEHPQSLDRLSILQQLGSVKRNVFVQHFSSLVLKCSLSPTISWQLLKYTTVGGLSIFRPAQTPEVY